MSDYNFCPQCGTQLKPDARFCSECGTRLDAYEVDLRAATGSDAPQQVGKARASETTGGIESQQSASAREVQATENAPTQAAKTPATDTAEPAGTESDSTASSFAAAVESTKHRSRRRVPLVVLVALALALTSAVAFAAYQVYTQVIAPAMQEQQQQVENEEQDEEAEGQMNAEAMAEATAAYQVVIDEYRNVLASDYVKSEERDWRDQEALKTANPDVNADMFPSMILDGDWKYAFVDINEDGVQELLIGAVDRYASSAAGGGLPVAGANHRLADIWTYTGGNLQRVTYGTERSHFILCEGGVLFNRGSSGAASGVCRYMKLKDGSVLEPAELRPYQTQEFLLDNPDNYYLLGEYRWNYRDGANGETEHYSQYTYPDGTVQEMESGAIPDAYRDLAEQYPGKADIDWQDF